MVTYAKSDSVWGPFEPYAMNPVLTNRNKAPYLIQAIGHGDLICDRYGDWHILCLGFRQIDIWQPFHHLGREVFLMPVQFGKDGWFTAGLDGTADESYEIQSEAGCVQQEKKCYTFENTPWNLDWCYLRHPHSENYECGENSLVLRGTPVTLDEVDSPTFIGLRQKDFSMELKCEVALEEPQSEVEAGVTMYMTEDEHYDIAVRRTKEGCEAVLKLNIGGIKHLQNRIALEGDHAELIVRADRLQYHFFVKTAQGEVELGSAFTKYLSSEVASGFTGVVMGLYAIGKGNAEFRGFSVNYQDAEK